MVSASESGTAALDTSTRRRRLVLFEHAPGKLVGYTTACLKAAAVDNPAIARSYSIDCVALAAEQYPLEANKNTLNRKDNALLCSIAASGLDVAGFSVFSWNVLYFARLSKILKLMLPKIRIIWGGKLATNDFQRLSVQNPHVDCFCIGEGELVLQDYLLDLLGEAPGTSAVPGTFMRVGDSYELGPPGRLPNLGNLPNPYLEGLIDTSMISQAYVETLRGCVYSCTFCDWGSKIYRTYDDEYICKVIRKCIELGFENIFFMDSVFAVQPSRRKRFLEEIVCADTGRSLFGFELFLEYLDDTSIDLFRCLSKKNALSKIEIGLQSTNPRTLKAIKRPHNPERFHRRYVDLVRGAPELQDRIQIDLIIGLPLETRGTFGVGLNTAFGLDPGIISTFPLDVFPGGEMHSGQTEEYALLHLEDPPYSIVSTSTMSALEIQELMSLSWAFVTMRSVIRRSLFYLHHAMGEDIFTFMNQFAQWCLMNGLVKSWLDYEKVERHLRNFLRYVNTQEFERNLVRKELLERLRQLIAFDMAPFFCTKGWDASAWEIYKSVDQGGDCGPEPSIMDRKGAFGFLFSRLPRWDSHPDSHDALLEIEGEPALLLVEVDGERFRNTLIDPRDLDVFTSVVEMRRRFCASKTPAPVEWLMGGETASLRVRLNIP